MTAIARWALWVAVAMFASSPALAAADDLYEPPRWRARALRLYVGQGFDVTRGPKVVMNGEVIDDEPYQLTPVGPNAVLRADVPLSELLMVGVQGTAMLWHTEVEERIWDSSHTTFDLSALVRLRGASGDHERHEYLVSLALGPSVDRVHLYGRVASAEVDPELALHAGLFVSYQYLPVRSRFGGFLDAGIMYHYVRATIRYEPAGGRRALEELVYHPVQLFARGGLMVAIY